LKDDVQGKNAYDFRICVSCARIAPMSLQFPASRLHAGRSGAVMLRNEIRARRLKTGDKINRTLGRAPCGNVCSEGLYSTMTSSLSSVSTKAASGWNRTQQVLVFCKHRKGSWGNTFMARSSWIPTSQ